MAKPCDARPIFFMFSGDMFLALRQGYQMNELCSKCGAHLSSPWRFCPLCGSVIPPQDLEQHAPSEPEKAPVQGAFSGLLFGVIVAPMCIIVGTMLCLTGLGAFLGVPMIIFFFLITRRPPRFPLFPHTALCR